ncbi:MAG: undecaprenyldiphospho-muramoylpentapeptide beta-N-acetylglucosaminyltransferase [Bacteroidales bacterium]|nr:undecaprenyldiphospho-muramoylpentapeptide beta-N-acetylglucosaminyltransferase [Bacteroidales bacterium]
MKNKKIIISGGGTGGHIFPAIAVAQALKRIDNNIEILFVGAKGKIEEIKVPEAGFDIKLISIKGFQRKISFETLKNILRLIKSLFRAFKIIRKFKPDVVVGVGGYASGPVVFSASLKGIPTLIQEQNSYPGITNKILSKKADKICIAYDAVKKYFPEDKIIETGNPIRKKITDTDATREEVLEFFNLEPDKKVILSLGGSGGAKSINNGIKAKLNKIAQSDVFFIWQTGKNYYEDSLKAVEKINASNIKIYDFIARMDLAYKAADLVISRAGAGTISELSMLEKAVILVPSPNVAEDHQTKNASALVNINAAVLIKDNETENKLIDTALELVNNEIKLKKLSENIIKEKRPNSDKLIAEEILKLIKE